jgi:hypothetical protein
MVRPLTAAPVPPSENNTNFLPVGETSSMSTSLGNGCENPVSVTVTFPIGAVTPETVMFDGYGVAVVLSLMAIAAGFENVCAPASPGTRTRPRHTTRADKDHRTISVLPC